jgi:hydrogenase maturation protease
MSNFDSLTQLNLEEFNNSSSLIYGIGNVGRQDDGLGWAYVDWLEEQELCPNAQFIRNYQLLLEDADVISHVKRVLFIDASKEPENNCFKLEQAKPSLDFSFTSHALSIPTIMATCQQCFNKLPQVYVLAIKGYEWELEQGLTRQASINLQRTKMATRESRAIALSE